MGAECSQAFEVTVHYRCRTTEFSSEPPEAQQSSSHQPIDGVSTPVSTIRIPTAKVFERLLVPARYKAAFGGRGSGKLLVWDKVMGLGTTDPLAGFAAVTANLVVSFYFAKRGFENVARIIKR